MGSGEGDSDSAVLNLQPGGRFGSYELLEKIRDNLGSVWRARHLGTDRVVALKILTGARLVSERRLGQFYREIDLASRLEHPGIARVYDGGEEDGWPFYTMEWIEGRVLDEFVSEGGGVGETVDVMIKVCEAVEAAHRKGIIHRDLKPSNIMVDAAGEPKVLDFGLARLSEGSAQLSTSSGAIAGTVAFMAPEQASGGREPPDTRSDVYSLGVILYRLLTGGSPYSVPDDAGVPALLRAVVGGEVAPPKDLAGGAPVPRDLGAIVMRCLEREPGRRYGSVAELGDELQRFQRGEPVEARPPGSVGRLARWARRKPAHLTVWVLGLALLAGAAIGGHLLVLKNERERELQSVAEAQLDLLLRADNAQLFEVVHSIEPSLPRLMPRMREIYQDPENGPELRSRAGFGMIYGDKSEFGRIRREMLGMTLAKSVPLRDRYAKELRKEPDGFWALTGEYMRTHHRRMAKRALVILAVADPPREGNLERWRRMTPMLADELALSARSDRPAHAALVPALEPLKDLLWPHLDRKANTSGSAELREAALEVLKHYYPKMDYAQPPAMPENVPGQ